MLKVQEIRELIRLIDQSSIDEFKYEYDGVKLEMKKNKEKVVKEIAKQTNGNNEHAPQEMTPTVTNHLTQSVQSSVQQTSEVTQQHTEETKTDKNLHKITSPMVGTFYQAPSPGAEPYVKVGSKITKNTIVCIIEAMKLFNEIEADVNGEIVEILVKDGQLVEYGQPLFLVKVE